MDFSKIRLNNERNSHVMKRRNRLGAWGFFKVLYRDNLWRLFGFSILMLIMIAPIFLVGTLGQTALNEVYQKLPTQNIFGFSTGAWWDVEEYYQQQVFNSNVTYGLMMVGASLLTFVVFSGGFAVIRDAFWTGKLSTVGVLRSLWMGIKSNAGYAFLSTAIIAFGVFGIYTFYAWLAKTILWLAIVLTILLSILWLFVVCYLLILCSVSVTYKQSVFENLDDSWRLLWMNVFPNLIHVVIALIPLVLMLVIPSTSMFRMLLLILMFMFGGMYFPLVWQTFMMRTFALFHPVEVKKKKDVMRELRAREAAEAQAREAAEQAAAARREARKNKHKKALAIPEETVEAPVAEAEQTPEVVSEEVAAPVEQTVEVVSASEDDAE